MNKNSDKTKEQLIAELAGLRKKSKEQAEKLMASNQQLDAHKLQLKTTEQQLRAANQQLVARNREIRRK